MTAQEEALQAKIAVLEAIAKESIKTPSIRTDTYFQEAEYLHKWCQADKAVLVQAGLDWGLVEDLPVRILAAREAQSVWHNVRPAREEAQGRWAAAAPRGYALRDEILHYMRYGYRDLPQLRTRLDGVAEGTTDADMIQDLNDLAVIGRENLQPLQAVGFDESKLDEAAQLSAELGGLRAEAAVDKAADRAQKLTRDRAYTHLKEAVDAVRAAGQFALWKHPERARGYASEHLRQVRAAAEAKSAEAMDTVDEEAAPPVDDAASM